jgi:hypothetical protein
MREDKEGAMAGSAAKVVISERQEKVLRKLSTATTLAKRLVQRATMHPARLLSVCLGRCQAAGRGYLNS